MEGKNSEEKKEPFLAEEKEGSQPGTEKPDEKPPASQSKELYWILGVMLALILIFVFASSVFKAANKFEYNGLTFTKEKFDEIPVFHYYYFYNSPITGNTVKYNLFLRNDPRNNEIPVEGEVYLVAGQTTYISVNASGLTQCEYSSVAIANLASFLKDNLVPAKSATPDAQLANETNIPKITCEDESGSPKIIIQSGNETKIAKENTNCYTITVANCEILPATEKFEVQSIIDARARQGL